MTKKMTKELCEERKIMYSDLIRSFYSFSCILLFIPDSFISLLQLIFDATS